MTKIDKWFLKYIFDFYKIEVIINKDNYFIYKLKKINIKNWGDLLDLVKEIVPYLIKQHCESDAVDLLIELADAKDFEETVEYGKADYEPYTITETLTISESLT